MDKIITYSMLSIIIINYNHRNYLKQCLKNIVEANINLDFEVIVIDNNSKDTSKKFLSELNIPSLKLKVILNNKNYGFAKANNQGIKLAQGKYVLILNPDVIVLKDSVEKLYQFLEENSEAAMVGPKLLNPNGTIQYSSCKFPCWYMPILRRTFLGKLPFLKKELGKYLMSDWQHNETREVDWLLGAALMIRKEVLEKINYFDERFFLYFEDTDLARRIWKFGKKVYYFPEAQMYHFHQRLSAERSASPTILSKITWIHIASGIKYFWKWRK